MTDAPFHQDESPHLHQPSGHASEADLRGTHPTWSFQDGGAHRNTDHPARRKTEHRSGTDPSAHQTLPSGFTFGTPAPAAAAASDDASDANDRTQADGEPHDPSPEWNLNMESDTDAPHAHDKDDAPAPEEASVDAADPKAAKRAQREARQRAKAEAKEAKRQAKEAKKATKGSGAAPADDASAAPQDAPVDETAEIELDMDDSADSADAGPDVIDDAVVPSPEEIPENPLESPLQTASATPDGQAPEESGTWAAIGEPTVEAVADEDAPESGLVLSADGAEGEGSDEEAPHARFGLRMGVHQKGGLISQIKAKLGLGGTQAAEVVTAQHQEEEEALAERIEPDERYKEIETYPIHPPYAHVRILYDDDMKEHVYQVLEPVLTRTEKEILEFISSTLVDTLSVSPAELEDADELEFITERFNDVIFDYSIILHEDEAEEVEIKKKLLYYIRRDFIGHGPIDAIMEDPYIEDISCDGPHVPIFLYHRKYESVRSTVIFGEHEVLDSYVIKMAQRAGKHISIAEPILDATMTDGSRLQSTLAKEVSAAGSTFTIRKFRPDPFTPPDLVMFRTMSAEMLAYLWISVQNGASIMYAGGTASGKTTSLNAILLFIPPNMKIVSIEDTREVNLPHENWIAGITRHGFGPRDQFGRQAGEIDMFQLLKNALRQRPEYIIVGEVRGQEAYSLFQAMATGHAAYGTMHADSVDAVIHRLESDPINIPRSLLEALDIVSVQVQTRVDGKRVRRTKQISEIVGLDPHTREILTNEVFRWQPEDDSFKFSGVSYSLEKFQLEKGLPAGAMIKELKRRAQIIGWMIDRRIQNYKEVNKVVSAYYKEPETLMKLVNGELGPDEVPIGLREIAGRGADAEDDNPLSAASLAAGKVALEGDDEGHQEPAPAHPQMHTNAAHAPYPEADAEGEAAPAHASSEHPKAPRHDEAPTAAEAASRQSDSSADQGSAPTEKAQDWAGMDALFQAAETHAKGDAKPDEAAEDPEAWLSEREAEARDAKASVDEAVEAASGSDEEDSAEAKGRRAKRASGGEENQ